MTGQSVDAIVIGAGPNGLVAANALADAGWEVLLLEANPEVGGAVSSADVTVPGFKSDMFSAFYPLAAASPIIQGLDLGSHGLTWVQAEKVLAHALPDGNAAVLYRSPEETAAGLEEFGKGDGQAWLDMFANWQTIRDSLLDAMFTPIPPVKSLLKLVSHTKVRGTLDLARLSVLPVRRLAAETFTGDGGGLLLTGNAMHADVPPEAAGSGVFGWLLAMLGQDVGFPVPQGGAQNLAFALQRRFESLGGQVRLDARVTEVVTSSGRAVGVRTADGTTVKARRAVLADVVAPTLYQDLVGLDKMPGRVRGDMKRFQWDNPTLKLNWALDGPVPWRAGGPHGAGTVHFGVDLDGFVDFAADLTLGRPPRHPFTLFGQMTTADPTRSPAGTESAWAYTHVPHAVAGNDGPAGRARRPGRAAPRGPGARIRRVRSRSARAVSERPAGRRRQPGQRRHQRRYVLPAPATDLPADAGLRSAGDADQEPVPGLRVGASGRRRARRVRLERGAVGTAQRHAGWTGATGLDQHGVGWTRPPLMRGVAGRCGAVQRASSRPRHVRVVIQALLSESGM